jgi:hypothetical protein
MKRIALSGILGLVLVLSLAPAASSADSRAHHAAIKLCKQKYKDAIRGAKYLRSRQRRARIEEARTEREECERLAPR